VTAEGRPEQIRKDVKCNIINEIDRGGSKTGSTSKLVEPGESGAATR
jgi:hypothetical protein